VGRSLRTDPGVRPTEEPLHLRRDPGFQPFATEPGEELYPNSIFEFNISRLIEETLGSDARIGLAAVIIPASTVDSHGRALSRL
jgi:hypothetical protein